MSIVCFSKNKTPYLQNSKGFTYIPYVADGKVGLGSFGIDEVFIGKPSEVMLTEDFTGYTFVCSGISIEEDSEERGTLKITGSNGRANLSILASMTKDVSAVSFDIAIDPELPINHRLFARIPFDEANATFVKFPYEETMTEKTGYKNVRRECDYSTVPAVFGAVNTVSGKYYLGVGYHLDENFAEGQIGYISGSGAGSGTRAGSGSGADSGFGIYTTDKCMIRTVDMQLSWKNDALRELNYDEEIAKTVRHLRFDAFGGRTQFEALRSHMLSCGYDRDVTMRRAIDDVTDDLTAMLRDNLAYEPHMGYHLMLRSDNGRFDNTIVRSGYGVMIPVASETSLAVEMYRYWSLNPDEVWAKERALEMADFYVHTQLPNGASVMYNTDTGLVDHNAPHGMPEGYFLITFDIAMGARAILTLYEEIKAREGIERADYLEAGTKAGYYIKSLVGEDGSIGRNYSFAGTYDAVSSGTAEPLLALSKLYEVTGDKSVDEARQKLEDWTWNEMFSLNRIQDSSHDSGAWDGSDKRICNSDSMFISTFIAYLADMHKKTADARYISMAKDVLMYQWLISVPIQMKDFKHYTRMLVREQDFYCNFDAPFKCQDYPVGYQYFAEAADEPAFMELLRIMTQTELDLQERDNSFKGIHLGLECDTNTMRPLDRFGEGKIIIPQVAGMVMGLKSGATGYAYVGGKGWGYGIDYQIPFDVSAIGDKPYVSSCTSMLRDESYNEQERTIRYWIYDDRRREADITIVWNDNYDARNAKIYFNESHQSVSELLNDGKLKLHLVGDGSPSKIVQIVLG